MADMRVSTHTLGLLIVVTAAVAAVMLVAAEPRLFATPVANGTTGPQPGADGKRRWAKPPVALPVTINLPRYRAGALPFRANERLIYSASWLGIPAANARIELRRKPQCPDLWTAEAWIRTNRLIDIFFRMRDYMKEEFHRGSLEPETMYIRQHENRRFHEYDVTFDRAAGLVTMVKRNRDGVAAPRRFKASDPWGPLSGAIMALTQSLEVGRTLKFDVFTGTHRFVFGFTVAGKERLDTPLGRLDALRVIPAVVYLSKGDLRQKVRRTIVWVSDDKQRLPLRIEASVFIGTVRADLMRVENVAASAAR